MRVRGILYVLSAGPTGADIRKIRLFFWKLAPRRAKRTSCTQPNNLFSEDAPRDVPKAFVPASSLRFVRAPCR